MARLSVLERANRRAEQDPGSSRTNPTTSTKRAPPKQLGPQKKKTKTAGAPVVAASSTPPPPPVQETPAPQPGPNSPPSLAATTSGGGESSRTVTLPSPPNSLFHGSTRGYAMAVGKAVIRDIDRASIKDATAQYLSESSCTLALQTMALQEAWVQKYKLAALKLQTLKLDLEKEKSASSSIISNLQLRLSEMEAEKTGTEKELDLLKLQAAADISKAKRDAVDAFQSSAFFTNTIEDAKAAAVEAYKRSDENLDWADERAVDYIQLGFARCRLQMLELGLIDAGADFSKLSFGRVTAGEPLVEGTAEAEEGEDRESGEVEEVQVIGEEPTVETINPIGRDSNVAEDAAP